MALKVDLLRRSFERVTERQPQLTRRFYQVLFERHPQVAPLFSPQRRERQERMLTEALVALMEHLEDAGWLTSVLPALGARHADYGVSDQMYTWVGECLLATLAEVAGDDWTPELAAAWADAYAAVSKLMIGGARVATVLRAS
jgi:hemoglobin-like flavoprotein